MSHSGWGVAARAQATVESVGINVLLWIYSGCLVAGLLAWAWPLFAPWLALIRMRRDATADRPASGIEVAESSNAAGYLRVLTLDANRCTGPDGVRDVARIANMIAQSRADIVALQNVSARARARAGCCQPARCARAQMLGCFLVQPDTPRPSPAPGRVRIRAAARPNA